MRQLIICLIMAAFVSPAASATQDNASLVGEQRDFIERFLADIPGARSASSERAAAAEFLVSELNRRGLDGERRPYRAPNVHPVLDLVMPPFSGVNVTATIPATRAAAPVVVLGAHYDSEAGSPGADDNASGVAALLTIAETIAQAERRDFTVLLAFFDQEEEGKIGSAALARQLVNGGVDIHSMHSIDMAGWDSDNDGAIEIDAPDAWFAIYQRAAEARGIPIARAHYDSSDHVSFRDLGIDAICLGEAFRLSDSSPHRHRSGDTAETINHAYLAQNTRLMEAVLLDLITGAGE